MATTILSIGLVVFLAHFLALQFRRTNVPDVLVLVLVGITVGPLLGIVQPEDFGKLGSVIATIALVVILFEGGTSLDLATLGRTAGTTGLLTLTCFALSAAAVVGVAIMAFDLVWIPALLLGATLASISTELN